MNSNEFRRVGKEMIDFVADYLDTIHERPVLPSVEPCYLEKLIPDAAPTNGESFDEIFADIERVIMPGMTHWHSPNFHAYFPTANSYPAILADILSGSLACIGFTWKASPACTELEMVMMDWLAKMILLPSCFLFSSKGKGGGVIQGTASEATLVALLAARNRVLSGDSSIDPGKLVAYSSEQAHSSVERAGLLGGVKIHFVPANPVNLGMEGENLADAINEDKKKGLIPFFIVATLGTTNTCAFDNLAEIGPVANQNNLWLHVDAAYAGSAFICPEFRDKMAGIEYVDSFNMNPHKWLLVNFDCSTLWFKDASYVVDSFSVDPVYLKHEMQGKVPDYRHWQIPLGRRFRSLKMWFVFRTYGVKGLRQHIRKQVTLAKEFEKFVASDDRFEIPYPVECGLVVFKLKNQPNSVNERLVNLINTRKNIHLVPTTVNEVYLIRFAVCARTTENSDIEFAWKEIVACTNEILK